MLVGGITNEKLNSNAPLEDVGGVRGLSYLVIKYWKSVDSNIISDKDLKAIKKISSSFPEDMASAATTYIYLGNHIAGVIASIHLGIKEMFKEEEAFKHMVSILHLFFYAYNIYLSKRGSNAIFVKGHLEDEYIFNSIRDFLQTNRVGINKSLDSIFTTTAFITKPSIIGTTAIFPCRSFSKRDSVATTNKIMWSFKDILMMSIMANSQENVKVMTSMPPLPLFAINFSFEVNKKVELSHNELVEDNQINNHEVYTEEEIIDKMIGVNADFLFALTTITNNFTVKEIYYGYVPNVEQFSFKHKNHTVNLIASGFNTKIK